MKGWIGSVTLEAAREKKKNKRLPVRICELPVEEQGLTHDRVVSERIRLPEAVRLQLAVGMHVLAYALRGLRVLSCKL